MRSPVINREGELREQPANPGSPGKKQCVCAEGVPLGTRELKN